MELLWEGKYDASGKRVAPVRIALPFQTVETVNESTQERQRAFDLFNDGQETDWRNRLIWGDKKYVLPSLLPEFAGKVNLIYIDPPFDTGANFSFTTTIPASSSIAVGNTPPLLTQVNNAEISFVKEPSMIEQKAYRDTWGVSPAESRRGVSSLDKYIKWFYETMVILRELLTEDGSIYVHLDYHVSFYCKVILDELFGGENYINEVVWKRADAHNDPAKYGNIHDTVLYYAKGNKRTWNSPKLTLIDAKLETDSHYVWDAQKGMYFRLGDLKAPGNRGPRYVYKGQDRYWKWTQEKLEAADTAGELYFTKNGIPFYKLWIENAEMGVQDIWMDLPQVKSGEEKQQYPTQKPEALLERIIKASSNEGDLILDCFCGSGTTAAVAEKLGRRWITCDLGRFAIHTARKRMLAIPNVKPFSVQNLGRYERQEWQKAEFGEDAPTLQLAYRNFMLNLYKARPLTGGYLWLHGVKNGRYVHVGSVDAPIAAREVQQIAVEFRQSVGSGKDAPETNGVDVLGWDFAFEINEMVRQQVEASNIKMRFIKIPREVLEKKAVEQGDIQFFELAALKVDVQTGGKSATVHLTDFLMDLDFVPADVQKAVTHWEQWIDYWAIDWDYQKDAFHNMDQQYRSRKSTGLQLQMAHIYAEAGTYTVLVKVIDILGNDTTRSLTVTIE